MCRVHLLVSIDAYCHICIIKMDGLHAIVYSVYDMFIVLTRSSSASSSTSSLLFLFFDYYLSLVVGWLFILQSIAYFCIATIRHFNMIILIAFKCRLHDCASARVRRTLPFNSGIVVHELIIIYIDCTNDFFLR